MTALSPATRARLQVAAVSVRLPLRRRWFRLCDALRHARYCAVTTILNRLVGEDEVASLRAEMLDLTAAVDLTERKMAAFERFFHILGAQARKDRETPSASPYAGTAPAPRRRRPTHSVAAQPRALRPHGCSLYLTHPHGGA